MKVKIDKKNNVATFSIDGEFSIYDAKDFKKQMMSNIDNIDVVTISLEKITNVDSAAIQLLIWFKKEFNRLNKKLILTNHSTPVLKAFDLFGLIAFFGDKIRIAKADKDKFSFKYGLKKVGNLK